MEAVNLFLHMARAGVLPRSSAYNLLIHGLCFIGRLDEARYVFDIMVHSSTRPTFQLYESLVYGFCKGKRVLEAEHICSTMKSHGLIPDRDMFNSLVYVYCKFGRMDLALNVSRRWGERVAMSLMFQHATCSSMGSSRWEMSVQHQSCLSSRREMGNQMLQLTLSWSIGT